MKTERELKLEWLSRGRTLRTLLVGLKTERMERLSRADYPGISYGGASGGSGNGTERRYAALSETEAEIHALEQELDRVEAEIREAIEQVQKPIYQTYLRMRFLGYKSESEIATETKYSFPYIDNHVRKKAIDAIKMMGNDG